MLISNQMPINEDESFFFQSIDRESDIQLSFRHSSFTEDDIELSIMASLVVLLGICESKMKIRKLSSLEIKTRELNCESVLSECE